MYSEHEWYLAGVQDILFDTRPACSEQSASTCVVFSSFVTYAQKLKTFSYPALQRS